MNVRNTFWYFACLLSLLFGFGLIVSKARTRVDDVFLLPSLKVAKNVVWDALVLERRDKDGKIETFRFAQNNKNWYLDENEQSLKVIESVFKSKLLGPMQNLQQDALLASSPDLAEYGLDKPRVVVTVKGRPEINGKTGAEREWKLSLGNDSQDGRYVYASTSDRPDRAYAVFKRDMDGYFFGTTNEFRSRRLFDFGPQDSAVQSILLRRGSDEVLLKRGEGLPWTFEKPPLGLANAEAVGGAGLAGGLLSDIVHIAVEKETDFVAADRRNLQKYNLSDNAASLTIQTSAKLWDGIDVETLLVGKHEGDYSYARLASDDGVFKIRTRLLQPILDVLARPGALRSRVILPTETLKARRIVMTRGKEQATLRFDDKAWHITMPGKSETPANEAVVKKLIASLDPKPEIERFIEEPKITDASLGLDEPREVLAFYEEAKSDKDKAQDRAIAVLALGKEEMGGVYCKRLLQSGDVSRFVIPAAAAQRMMANTFVPLTDPSLPRLDIAQLHKVDIDAAGRKFEFERKSGDWIMTTTAEPTPQTADRELVSDLTVRFAHLEVRRWLKKVDPKADLAPYGLAKPEIVLRLFSKKKVEATDKEAAKDVLETTEIKLSKETELTGDGLIVYGMDSRKPDYVFVAPAALARFVLNTNFEDRNGLLRTSVAGVVSLFGLSGTPYPLASPLATGTLVNIEPARVKELKLTVRGSIETRQLIFARQDKTWIDKSGLQGFQLNPDKVDEALRLVARPEFITFVGFDGSTRKLFKLQPENAVLLLQATLEDGNIVTLTIGAKYEQTRFAVFSTWPQAVFLVPQVRVDELLKGPAYFSRPMAQ